MNTPRTYRIYLAGPLFTLADRTHNQRLEKHLIELGYEVILPQRRALDFNTPDGLRLNDMANDCMEHARNPENILVANIDGPEADSGTAIEYGLAIGSTGRAIICRTDIRTEPEKEVGINAMFRIGNTKLILLPCFATTEEEFEEFYRKLASEIDAAIRSL